MDIKAVIFDFDGVLVESMGIKARAFADLFKNYPEHVEKIIELHMLHGGLSRFEKFEIIYRDILKEPLSPVLKEELGKQFKAFVFKAVINCPFVNGAYEFLNKYYQEIPLFVVSGTPEEEIRKIIKARGLEKFFREVLGAPAKKLELNQRILKQYKFDPQEICFIGDSIDDYEGVQNTGIRFIARELKKGYFSGLNGVEAIINDITDLEKIIHAS